MPKYWSKSDFLQGVVVVCANLLIVITYHDWLILGSPCVVSFMFHCSIFSVAIYKRDNCPLFRCCAIYWFKNRRKVSLTHLEMSDFFLDKSILCLTFLHLAPYVPSRLRNHLPSLPAKFLISTTTLVSRFSHSFAC